MTVLRLKTDAVYILCSNHIEEYRVNLSCDINEVDKIPIYSTTFGVIVDNTLILPKVQEKTEVVVQAKVDDVLDEVKIYMKPAIDVIPDMPTDIEILQLELGILREENMGLMLASAEIYETMFAENNQLMLALAEVYEMIYGGVM